MNHEDLFLFNTTPIFKLPQDCILIIFSLFSDVKTLTLLSSVCKLWKRFISHTFLWRNVRYEFHHFSRHLKALNQRNNSRGSQQLSHVKSLAILLPSREENTGSTRLTEMPDTSPFTQLEKLYLINWHITDINKIIKLLSRVKLLRCERIRRESDQITIQFWMFSQLYQLEGLHLHFQKPCNPGGAHTPFFTPNLSTIKPSFAPSLRRLRLLNISDIEGPMIQQRQESIILRESAEEGLLAKYRALTRGISLRELYLDRCGALTATIWRTCMIPCTRQLNYLFLAGRKRESLMDNVPDDLYAFLDVDGLDDATKEIELEDALKEFFGALKHIKEIRLVDFACTKGIVSGIKQLSKPYRINGEENVSIESYLNKIVDVHLEFIT
ncbi:unnamed protein product [Rhizopus stolonifer]